jgi:hypothetical protein
VRIGRTPGRALVVAAIAGVGMAAFACGKKSKAPAEELVGLAAVPATAQVVIVADVAKVARSPLVERAVQQLLARDANLAEPWEKLRTSCKIDFIKQVKNVILAVGPRPTQAPAGPVILVATGTLGEQEFAGCVRSMVGTGGGSLSAKPLEGRTLYTSKDGNRVVYFAFTRPDTVILGSSEPFVTEALGTDKKVMAGDLRKWIDLADQNQPIWGAGILDERVRQGLLRPTGGKLSSGPLAMIVGGDLSDGAKLELDVAMANPADAKTLESFVKDNLTGLAMAAQIFRMQKAVEHLSVAADGSLVRLKLALSVEDINQLISSLDDRGSAAQDSPPAAGSGSAAP